MERNRRHRHVRPLDQSIIVALSPAKHTARRGRGWRLPIEDGWSSGCSTRHGTVAHTCSRFCLHQSPTMASSARCDRSIFSCDDHSRNSSSCRRGQTSATTGIHVSCGNGAQARSSLHASHMRLAPTVICPLTNKARIDSGRACMALLRTLRKSPQGSASSCNTKRWVEFSGVLARHSR